MSKCIRCRFCSVRFSFKEVKNQDAWDRLSDHVLSNHQNDFLTLRTLLMKGVI